MELGPDAFTVVVANDDEDGRSLLELAMGWRACGLLVDFAWVTPSDVAVPAQGPAYVTALSSDDGARSELMTLLGSRQRSMIRVIVLHLLTHEHSSFEQLADTCDRVADLVQRAIPVQVDGDQSEMGMRLLRVNLMTPESELVPQRSDIVRPGWEVNAIVSPEDRPELNRVSVFVRRGANLYGHALAAVASAGGLWRGAPTGAFDNKAVDSSMGGKELSVMRTQARIVVGDDRALTLARDVAQAVERSDAGVECLTWGLPADDPDLLVRRALDHVLAAPEWRRRPPEARTIEPRQTSLGTLLHEWGRFQSRLPGAATRFFGERAIAVIENSVTSLTVGEESGTIGRLIPLTPIEAESLARSRLQAVVENSVAAQRTVEASTWGQSSPAAWRLLRSVCLGLVDGSHIPGTFSRPQRAGLDEVLRPENVVPDPARPFVHEGAPIGVVDVARVAEILAEADGDRLSQPASPDAAATEPTGSVSAPSPHPSAGKRASLAAPTTDDSQRTATGSADPSDFQSSFAETVEAWARQPKRSLLWRLASHAYELQRQEQGCQAAALKDTRDVQPPGTKRLARAKWALVASWVVGLVVSLVVVVWLMVIVAGRSSFSLTWFLAGVVVAVAAWLVGGSVYFHALRAYEWSVHQLQRRVLLANDEYVRASQEAKRWMVMYRGITDWAQILGRVIHHPWGASMQRLAREPVDADGLPAAVAVAEPISGGAAPSSDAVAACARLVCQRGWLSAEFDRYVEAGNVVGPAESSHGDIAADLDLGLRSHGARTELRRLVESEDLHVAAMDDLVARVNDFVIKGTLRLPSQLVRRMGPYSSGEVTDDLQFLTASQQTQVPLSADIFVDHAQVSGRSVPSRVILNLPTTASPPRLPGAEVYPGDTFISTRTDIATGLLDEDIRIFERQRVERPRLVVNEDFN